MIMALIGAIAVLAVCAGYAVHQASVLQASSTPLPLSPSVVTAPSQPLEAPSVMSAPQTPAPMAPSVVGGQETKETALQPT